MEFLGRSIIGFRDGHAGKPGEAGNGTFQAFAPVTGQKIEPAYYSATAEEVDLAVRLAAEASVEFGRLSGAKKAEFLETIASRIEAQTESLVTRANQESALPPARLQSETGRTCAQLRMFAKVVREGSWVTARIDRSDPQRKPVPKPDVRSMLRPLGPVVVFGASNFPLAFSVAGGDTASAFAAGNPVIVKAHPAHPGTSELVGRIIRDSVRACDLPEGVFSLLFDSGTSVGAALVQHPLVKAVGFTGSIPAGRALFDLAAKRPSPIPFYGEMGSTNPTFILPGALAARGEKIAAELYGSFTLGAGQFCTKPGLIFLSEGKPAEAACKCNQNQSRGIREVHPADFRHQRRRTPARFASVKIAATSACSPKKNLPIQRPPFKQALRFSRRTSPHSSPTPISRAKFSAQKLC